MENKKLNDCQLKQLEEMFRLYEMDGISGKFVKKDEKEQNEEYDNFIFSGDGSSYEDYSDR